MRGPGISVSAPTSVAGYLKARLEQLGLDRMFGVAGNYTAPFLDTILADPLSPIAITGSPNELCAGFAADAYARFRGFGCLYTTYSVGSFSLLNAIAGSYVERVPVLLVNGAPTSKETSVEQNAALLYSHTTGYDLVDIHMFRPVTAACERITNGGQAPFQIDSVLTAMLTDHRPGYLEVAEDVWRAPCAAPVGTLRSGAGQIVAAHEAQDAVAATLALMAQRPKSILWAGAELQRFGLEKEFLALLDAINAGREPEERVRFVTTSMSKSVISEDHPSFDGCVTLANTEIQSLVGRDGLILGLGGWTTSKDTGNDVISGPGTVLAANGSVVIGAGFYPLVDLDAYVEGLTAAFAADERVRPRRLGRRPLTRFGAVAAGESAPDAVLTYDTFFSALGRWVAVDDILVVDAGFPLIGAQGVHIAAKDGFVAQAAWLSIGYSVPAATGVACANPGKRAVVVVGDGAFHETCQAVSDHTAHGHNTAVFVLSNGLYGIEQYLVNPNPFRTPPVAYPDPLLNTAYPYNLLPAWDFVALAQAFGAVGRRACTTADLMAVLAEIRTTPERNFVVEVCLPIADLPHVLAAAAAGSVGEDEIENPGWPPVDTF